MKIKTQITASKLFNKQLGKVPDFIAKKVMFWIYLVEHDGIWVVSESKGLHDEPLKGERKGQRSVRINRSYRVIYRVVEDRIHIELLEVNKHDY